MEFSSSAKILMTAGVVLLVAGLIWQFVGPHLSLGRLPGDIAVEKENFKFYFPITTSILLSVVLSLLFWAFRKFF